MNADVDLGTLIAICALVTYATRVGGHLLLARLPRIPFRLEAALNAVPVAVLAALIAPPILGSGPPEFIAAAIACAVGFRLSAAWVVGLGVLALVMVRGVLG